MPQVLPATTRLLPLAAIPKDGDRDIAIDMSVSDFARADRWRRLRDELYARGAAENAEQWRAARAAILLMGDSGLRREEVASAH
ncbi:hypothetical protein [Caballeronia sp. Lep1P3]|uniref:hypothetical protein n=1 Tax=Caballeronia sp. Lep1P3 TaxID=2878150 RepID=UPI001FD1BF6A|nr:hypothetical protein [Caballeronia sp. Lep1P3]